MTDENDEGKRRTKMTREDDEWRPPPEPCRLRLPSLSSLTRHFHFFISFFARHFHSSFSIPSHSSSVTPSIHRRVRRHVAESEELGQLARIHLVDDHLPEVLLPPPED